MGGSTRRNDFAAMGEGQPVSVPFMPAIGIDLGPFAGEAQISAEMQGRAVPACRGLRYRMAIPTQGSAVFLSVSTTHHPATDLGFLLHKNPGRVHELELNFGRAAMSSSAMRALDP